MRTRLTPDQRRAQLLDVGAQLFAVRPYDEVYIEDVAEQAGVSRGLMYRYFATKRDLFRAVITEAAERVLVMTAPDESLTVAARVTTALEQYFAHIESNAHAIRALATGMASGDPELLRIMRDAERRQEDRIVDQLAGLGVAATATVRVAIRGWLVMTRALAIDWLNTREVSRDELRDICARQLLAIAADAGLPEQ